MGYEKIIYYPMKLSRSSRSLGMVLVGLVLLPLLTLAWFIPCHADVHNCAGIAPTANAAAATRCLLSAANPAPIVGHYVSPYHAVEEQPARNVFASSIFRPPRA